jgi:hypothetical protein
VQAFLALTVIRPATADPTTLGSLWPVREKPCGGKLVYGKGQARLFMDKRYQVFVSSTYRDLQEARQEVMQALLELDCIPSGMELFPAADEDQWQLIQRVIGECDYYVLILAGRYGSIGPEGISYTEMEYRYALKIGKPTIAFLHGDVSSLPTNRSEDSSESRQKLRDFRELAKKKLCKFWTGPEDLGAVVSRSITQLTKHRPAIGWVRANALPAQDTSLELLRLRKRVDELEAELQRVRKSPPQGSERLAQGEETFTIHYAFYKGDEEEGEGASEFAPTWNEIFSAVGSLLIPGACEEEGVERRLDQFIESRHRDSYFRWVRVEPFDFETLASHRDTK